MHRLHRLFVLLASLALAPATSNELVTGQVRYEVFVSSRDLLP
jgi:hypothetical protein